ncbi:MAG: HAD-IC family P-type ATPase, partial [Gemmatimonadota bacterium]|nr:HAD-IC family P-type ATPase [Gemmatimonadota bacterium]
MTEAEAQLRLKRFGANLLRPPATDPWQRILVHQFRSVVVALLVGVFALALIVGDYLEAVAIGAVLVINTALGFFTELRAVRAMESLQRLQVHGAVAVRGGERRAQDAKDLVPGDVLVLEAGSAVAADARICEARELEVNEAPLTGESLPVAKSPDPLPEDQEGGVPLADRSCMVYKGTFVTAGEGLAYVVGTGRQTEIGRVGELIQSVESGPSPLERKLAELGRRLVVVALGVALAITLLGIAQGRETWLMVETGIALAIAAIPEGLPVVATIALAVGLRRMARRNALVRDLHSVESLGSVTVVCADKTGTLTTGRMAVRNVWVGGEDIGIGEDDSLFMGEAGVSERPESHPGLVDLIRGAVLASRGGPEGSDHALAVGDPTEVALHELGSRAGLQHSSLSSEFPEVASVPFSSERMLAASFRETNGRTVAYVKGAPQRLLELSSRAVMPKGPVPMDVEFGEMVLRKNGAMAAEGLRVLAVAQREVPRATALTEEALESLEFVGLVGIADPPAPGVSKTLETLREAGIVTVMITGDQAATAEAVAREIGLLQGGDVLTARDLTDLETAQLDRVRVFARVTPKDKLAIVGAFQKRGDMVAMVGDGINDAPAMKQADVGVAMGGRGTDVAKETADLVIQDDRLETVTVAVEEGR